MIDPRAGPMTDLTEAESQLVSGVIAGRRVDLKGETIRASTLRTLAIEARSDWTLQPVFEVMVEVLDPKWWKTYRKTLEKSFRQKSIIVRAQDIQLL